MDVTKSLPDREHAWFWLGAGGVLFLIILLFLYPYQPPQEPQAEQHEGEHMSMQTIHEMNPARQAKLLADRKESEFNHHLAGLLAVLAGAFTLFQTVSVKRSAAVKYASPMCFLLVGILVLVLSDTELWPFGHREWLEALRNNQEVLQHKTFAVLLLVLGVIEWQRASGVLKAIWGWWVFPALAIGGSFLLLFHQHGGGMHGPNHIEQMARIQSEHLSYAVVGIGIGLTKALAEVKTRLRRGFGQTWPVLLIVLGVLLMFYQE
jgi:hypothetical protein